MWFRFIEVLIERGIVKRFKNHLDKFWQDEKTHVYFSDSKIIVVVEMLDPTLKTGILDFFGLYFEGYEIVVKRCPRGYISYAKKKRLFN